MNRERRKWYTEIPLNKVAPVLSGNAVELDMMGNWTLNKWREQYTKILQTDKSFKLPYTSYDLEKARDMAVRKVAELLFKSKDNQEDVKRFHLSEEEIRRGVRGSIDRHLDLLPRPPASKEIFEALRKVATGQSV
ncbi:MAG TPA: hypothetical protein VND15_03640 [Candidatus Acidoferrales bacterium]|nr:hypothetical protein [Candidatus Acidoferrales bacterium]